MRVVGLCLAMVLISSLNAIGGTPQTMWDMKTLSEAPKTYPAPEWEPKGDKAVLFEGDLPTPELRERAIKECRVRSLYFEGLPYKGKPTRVFAFYGVPDVPPDARLPAMVLVHGGGGTAFESWVRAWNLRGYAAIAMDTCGCIPDGEYSKWKHHEYGGPAGWGGFDQITEPVQDQWPYHAVADVILAHSLLRSFPEVDPARIGITGISWGGYLTCIASSVDSRFRFTIPVYGCGFLGDNSTWLDVFAKMGKTDADLWLKQWDPSSYLPLSSTPMLWVDGTNDFAYPMDSLQKSYRLPKGPRTLATRVRMGHGHGGLGENPEEIAAFAESFCHRTKPLASIISQGVKEGKLLARFTTPTTVRKAELNFTKDTGRWQDRKWETIPAKVDDSDASATIPDGTTVAYLNIIDDRGLIVSTEHVEFPSVPKASEETRKPVAVQAFLDRPNEEKIRSLVLSVPDVKGLKCDIKGGMMPHFTMASWLMTADETQQAASNYKNRLRRVRGAVPVKVQWKQEEDGDRVSFYLVPVDSPELVKLHSQIHKRLGWTYPPFREIDLPGKWIAHLTLFSIPRKQLPQVQGVVDELKKITSVTVERLGLIYFGPLQTLSEVDLRTSD